jgi:hypothetical protein
MPTRVHLMSGFAPSGHRVRAVCSCGYQTTPRVDERRALEALTSEHGSTRPVCALCGRDYEGRDWLQLRRDLQILPDPYSDDRVLDQFLVCRDAPQACRDGARQRQVHLDRAVAEAWGLPELTRPRLRVVGGATQRDI